MVHLCRVLTEVLLGLRGCGLRAGAVGIFLALLLSRVKRPINIPTVRRDAPDFVCVRRSLTLDVSRQ